MYESIMKVIAIPHELHFTSDVLFRWQSLPR